MSSLSRPLLRKQLLAGTPPAWLARNGRADRVAAAALSCPPWVDRRWLAEFQREARRRSKATGIPHVVDHIIPIVHPLVCGLTVPWNLRIIPKAINDRKSNALGFNADLFDEPEQLRLV